MEAIVLAGGFGTRLRPVVSDVPKPMAPVAGRPFLEILLGSLAAKGVRRAVLSVGHLADTVISHFGDAWGGLSIAYAVESEPLGTGGATKLALAQCRDDPVLVLNGDTFLDLELDALVGQWRGSGAPIVVARAVDDTARFGRLGIDGRRIVAFAEKGVPGPGLINAGCYLLPRGFLDDMPAARAFSLETDVFVPRVAASVVEVFTSSGLFIDIGVPDDYARAQTLLAPLVPGR